MEGEIGIDARFAMICKFAIDYDWKIDAWHDAYAIFYKNGTYLRVFWETQNVWTYGGEGNIVMLDRDDLDMLDEMFFVNDLWNGELL